MPAEATSRLFPHAFGRPVNHAVNQILLPCGVLLKLSSFLSDVLLVLLTKCISQGKKAIHKLDLRERLPVYGSPHSNSESITLI